MFRLLGFCLGSIVSIAALVMLVGMPELHLSGDDDDEQRFDTAVEKLRAKQLTQLARTEPAPPQEPEPVVIAAAAESGTPEDRIPDEDPPGQSSPADAENGTADSAETATAQNAGPEWYVLWTPFRSEIAARGFVSRLESVTGLDYRVEKLETGVYEVAVPYHDDTELSAKLSQISSATGLDVSGRLP
jgi:hypothetical protein